MSCLVRVIFRLLCAAILPLQAHAHLMPAGNATVRVLGDSAFVLIAIPAASLQGYDADGDGLLGLDELNAHRASLAQQVSNMLDLSDDGRPGRLVFEDLILSHQDGTVPKGLDHVVAMRRYQWDAPVRSFRLRAAIFDDRAVRDGQLAVRAVLGERAEAAVLTRHRSSHEFFAGPWASFRNFMVSGTQHILLGADHLVFLLTLLVAGAGWRYWAAAITAFTIAHSITLTFAALGWVQAPPQIIEPLIAASIVVLALHNLLRHTAAARHRMALVFACGLLHGMGIAAVLTDLGLSTENRVLSLLGFNLGVELGQVAFVAAMLALLHLVQRQLPAHWHAMSLRACSLLAALAGTGWMIERTLV